MTMKNLYVFVAHIDDFECACIGYVLRNYRDYDNITIITASTWPAKTKIWQTNLAELIEQFELDQIVDINLGFPQRKLWSLFDEVKDNFYSHFDFSKRFDILTHDESDCHTDHVVCNKIAMGLYKYCDRFLTMFSPSSARFQPNYFAPLDPEEFAFKARALDKYNIGNEESYTKLGYYLNSHEHYNIGHAHVLENYARTSSKYHEIYKIEKWL